MTDEALQQRWKTYQDAWSDVTNEERLRLLRSVLIEDIPFSNPDDQDHGIERLAASIADFQQRTPGGYFRNTLLRQQHGQLLVAWTLFDRNDLPLVNGHSYGLFDEDTGQITRLAGFWKL